VTVWFGLLGDVMASIDDDPVDLGHARQQCVLVALLAEANTTVTVDQLIDRVWADRPIQRARDTLYGYLHRLRRALAPADDVEIRRTGRGYLIAVDPMAVDVHHFAQLLTEARTLRDDEKHCLARFDQALGLWRADDAFVGLDTPWLDAWRQALRRQRFAAELDRTDVALRLGRHNEVLAELSAYVAGYPLDERLAGQLMLALYRCGRPAEALEHYRRTRMMLAEEFGTDPSAPLQQLQQQILTTDPALARPATAEPRAVPVPRQLPMPPPVFTGREHELAVLDKVLDGVGDPGGPVVISAIGGAGGIGKTWLALHWAHGHLDQFQDGQLYLNLRGFDPSGEPVPPGSALRSFLYALGVDPAAIPADLDARAGLYRSLLAGRRMLIVLDNAYDTAQVTPLLPGDTTSVVLITSRSQLASLVITHGARPLTLDVLTDTEAYQLLVHLLGAGRVADEPDAVSALVARCAGLPLALGIVAARAAAQPRFPLRVLAEELTDTTARLDALDAGDLSVNLRRVFACSYQALPTETARACRLLGIAPGPDISLPAAAALIGQPAAYTRTLLRQAATAHLVQEHQPGRYRMHDLLRLYAAEQAEQVDSGATRQAALRRVVDFYLHTAHLGDGFLLTQRDEIQLDPPDPAVAVPPLADRAAALAWFDAEHPGLLAAQRVATGQKWYPQVWQLAWALTLFHWRQGHRQHDHTVWQAALAAAGHLGDPSAEAMAYRRFGVACQRLGYDAEARENLRQALTRYEQTGNALGQAHTHLALSLIWTHQGDHEQALIHASHTLRLARSLDDPAWQADALNAVGWCQAQLGRHEQAAGYCEQALALSRQHGYRECETATLDSLGYIAHSTGDHPTALGYYRQVLALRRDLGDAYDEADVLARLGDIHAELGQQLEARQAWTRALALYRTQHRIQPAQDTADKLDRDPRDA
jgi:DNA-binding SARP family transcriptional activator/Tfp pilus assembly protein PilF